MCRTACRPSCRRAVLSSSSRRSPHALSSLPSSSPHDRITQVGQRIPPHAPGADKHGANEPHAHRNDTDSSRPSRRNASSHIRKTIRRMKRKTRRASKTPQQDDMTRRMDGYTEIERDDLRGDANEKNANEQAIRNETIERDEKRDAPRDEQEQQASNERRQDRKNETPHGTPGRDGARDDIRKRTHRQPIKKIKHREEKHQITTFIARPPPACSPPSADLKQILRPRAWDERTETTPPRRRHFNQLTHRMNGQSVKGTRSTTRGQDEMTSRRTGRGNGRITRDGKQDEGRKAGRDEMDKENELPPACELANLLTCLLAYLRTCPLYLLCFLVPRLVSRLVPARAVPSFRPPFRPATSSYPHPVERYERRGGFLIRSSH